MLLLILSLPDSVVEKEGFLKNRVPEKEEARDLKEDRAKEEENTERRTHLCSIVAHVD